jgi:tripartite-type tricarboxylate transporter receptor subunit TctC
MGTNPDRRNFGKALLTTAGLAVGLALIGTGAAKAAEYPSQTIRWILPYGTGGSYDQLARGLGPLLSAKLGVSVVVENIPGPDGYNRIFNAKPDGYTIGMADPVGETANGLVTKVPYNLKDLTWIGRINASANLMVASKKSGITSYADLKNRKETLRVAAFGMATPLVQAGILTAREKIPMQSVNFRNIGDMIFGVVRGDADIGFLGAQPWLKHIEAGNVVPIMVWGNERDPLVPTAVSLKEIGYSELEHLSNHRSIVAPPKLPKDVHDKLVAAFNAVVSQGEGLAWLQKQKFETNPVWGQPYATSVVSIQQSIDQYKDLLIRIATQ